MKSPKKKSGGSYLIGDKVYEGRVNRHATLIKREPEAIFSRLIDLNQWSQWVPMEQISVEKVTPGEFRVGTKLHYKLRYRIQPEWDSEVIHLEKDRRIVNQFQNGIFGGGIEVWDLKKTDSATEVTHTLVYQIHRWIYRIGWFFLGGERKHDELTEMALHRLKSVVERSG